MIESLPPPNITSRSKSLPPKTPSHQYTPLPSYFQTPSSSTFRFYPKAFHASPKPNRKEHESVPRQQPERQQPVVMKHDQESSSIHESGVSTLPRLQTKTGWRPLHQPLDLNAISASAAEPSPIIPVLPPWKSANEALYGEALSATSVVDEVADVNPCGELGPIFYSPIQETPEEGETTAHSETPSLLQWLTGWLQIQPKIVVTAPEGNSTNNSKLTRPKSLPPLLGWNGLMQSFESHDTNNENTRDEMEQSSKSAIEWTSDALDYHSPMQRRYSHGGHLRRASHDSTSSSLYVRHPTSSLSPLVDNLEFNPWQASNPEHRQHLRLNGSSASIPPPLAPHQRLLRRNSSIHRRQRSEPMDVFNSPPSELASWGSRASNTWSQGMTSRTIEEQQWIHKRSDGAHRRLQSNASTVSNTSTISARRSQHLSSLTMTFNESGLDSFPKIDSFRQHRRRRSAVEMLTPFFQSVSGDDHYDSHSDPLRSHHNRYRSQLHSAIDERNSAGLPSPSLFLGLPIKHYVPLEFRSIGLFVTVDAPQVPPPQQRVSSFTTYTVTVKLLKPFVPGFLNEKSMTWSVQKRYKEFREMYMNLKSKYPNEFDTIPSLPPRIFIGRYHHKVVSERAQSFHAILSCIVLNPILQKSPLLISFLNTSRDSENIQDIPQAEDEEASTIMDRSTSLQPALQEPRSENDSRVVQRSKSFDSLALK